MAEQEKTRTPGEIPGAAQPPTGDAKKKEGGEKDAAGPQTGTETTPDSPEGTAGEEEEKEENPVEAAARKTGSLTTPEAILMFTISGALDALGIVIFILSFFGIGLFLSYITDFIGLVSIGFWMYVRSGQTNVPKRRRRGAQKGAKKVGSRIGKRLGLAFLSEIIPFLGDIAPSWTIAVYFELKNNPI